MNEKQMVEVVAAALRSRDKAVKELEDFKKLYEDMSSLANVHQDKVFSLKQDLQNEKELQDAMIRTIKRLSAKVRDEL